MLQAKNANFQKYFSKMKFLSFDAAAKRKNNFGGNRHAGRVVR